MANTTHAAAGPYEQINDPADLHEIARDGLAGKRRRLVWPGLFEKVTVDVSGAEDGVPSPSGTLRVPNARNMENMDPTEGLGVALNAPSPKTRNRFPSDTVDFKNLKYAGQTPEPIAKLVRNGYSRSALSKVERALTDEAALGAWQKVEAEAAKLLMTQANWQTTTVAAITNGGGNQWSDDAATVMRDSLALLGMFHDNCAELPTHYVIPPHIIRSIGHLAELREYLVAGDRAMGVAAAAGGKQVLTPGAVRAALQAMLSDYDDGFNEAKGGVRVVVPYFKPFLLSAKKAATTANRTWIWGDNKVGMFHLHLDDEALRLGTEYKLSNRTGAVLTRYADFEADIRETSDREIYANVEGAFGLTKIDKDYGLVATAVLT